MPTLDQLRARTTAAVDAKLSEPVGSFFLNKGKTDPTRINGTLQGILVVGTGAQDSAAGRVQSWGSRIASGKAQLHIARATYAGPAFQEGDKVRAINRPGRPFFEVSHVDDRDATRLVLHLTEA